MTSLDLILPFYWYHAPLKSSRGRERFFVSLLSPSIIFCFSCINTHEWVAHRALWFLSLWFNSFCSKSRPLKQSKLKSFTCLTNFVVQITFTEVPSTSSLWQAQYLTVSYHQENIIQNLRSSTHTSSTSLLSSIHSTFNVTNAPRCLSIVLQHVLQLLHQHLLSFQPRCYNSLNISYPVVEISYSSTFFSSSTTTLQTHLCYNSLHIQCYQLTPLLKYRTPAQVLSPPPRPLQTHLCYNSFHIQCYQLTLLLKYRTPAQSLSPPPRPFQTHLRYNSLHIQCYQLTPLLKYRTPVRFSAPLPHLFKLIHVTIHSTFNVTNSPRY